MNTSKFSKKGNLEEFLSFVSSLEEIAKLCTDFVQTICTVGATVE